MWTAPQIRAANWMTVLVFSAVNGAAGLLLGETGPIAVLTVRGVPSYHTAVEGIQNEAARATGQQFQVFELTGTDDASTLVRLRSTNPSLLICVGIRASTAAAALGLPYIATMLLQQEAEQIAPAGAMLAAVTLDVTPRTALLQIRKAFPARRRVAVVRSPVHIGASMEEITAQASALGITVIPVECDGPKSLLESVPKLRGRADLIWCLPDRNLYETPAVQALILSSLRFGLPLIGFSEPFLRAGALVAVVPDYRDLGRQTAEVARQCRNGAKVPARQTAHSIRSMVNERAGRALGVDLSSLPADVERIR